MTKDEKKAALKIAKVIQETRKSKGWTQIDCARLIGISQSHLSKLENAILIPSVHQWFEFCNATGISPDSYLWES